MTDRALNAALLAYMVGWPVAIVLLVAVVLGVIRLPLPVSIFLASFVGSCVRCVPEMYAEVRRHGFL
jgi:hypothetical protein